MAHRVQINAQGGRHLVYSGRSLVVTSADGWVTGDSIEGYYVDETRLLSQFEIRARGEPLLTFAASPRGGDYFFACAEIPESASVPAGKVYLEYAIRVSEGFRARLRLVNYDHTQAVHFPLAIYLDADFADLAEARDGVRQQTAAVTARWQEGCQELHFQYHHPELDRAVAIRVDRAPVPAQWVEGAMTFSLDLAHHEPVEIDLAISPQFDGVRVEPGGLTGQQPVGALDALRTRLRDNSTALTSTNPTVARAWITAVNDLASLPLGLEPGPAAPIAGLPMYQQFFGRDTLTTAWQAMLAVPELMKDTLLLNASWQGTTTHDWLDEQPGKMIHQARWGPTSQLGIDPFQRYYGDYATPPSFLIMLGQYLAWTHDVDTVRALLPTARRALDWLERLGDLDGDGFLEYVTRSEKGVTNQGWKDSFDAVVDGHGQIIEPPIATCELQAYWYIALELAAPVFFLTGDRRYALELYRSARALRKRIDDAFWMEEEGFYAYALGPDKKLIRSIASNAGHLLAAGVVPAERSQAVASRLMREDMFSGWGIRTLSSQHVAYNPFSYHLGSVWPVENGTIAFGLARYGCWDELHRLSEGLFAATELFPEGRLPEALGGLPRDAERPHPGIYPSSNSPQSWSASMIVLLVQALLGLRPVAPLHVLLVDPHLPAWLPDLRLDGIRIGNSRLDLEFGRNGDGETRVRVVGREGPVRVIHQPVPQGPEASLFGRAKALAGSIAIPLRS